MGCYEVSLGDTVGKGTPATVSTMLETVMGGAGGIPATKLAVCSTSASPALSVSDDVRIFFRATSMIHSALLSPTS